MLELSNYGNLIMLILYDKEIYHKDFFLSTTIFPGFDENTGRFLQYIYI